VEVPNNRLDRKLDVAELDRLARRIRFHLVQMSHRAGTPHLGSGLSCVDILVAAYFGALRLDPTQPESHSRDRFILSKGHAAAALYATLAERGFFPTAWLEEFGRHGSPLAEQPAPHCAPGVELATGSLGHGLPVGIGMALAARIQQQDYRDSCSTTSSPYTASRLTFLGLFVSTRMRWRPRSRRICAPMP
jgi:transketolase